MCKMKVFKTQMSMKFERLDSRNTTSRVAIATGKNYTICSASCADSNDTITVTL